MQNRAAGLLVLGLTAWYSPMLFGAPAAPDFDRTVAPLLARRCLECHAGAKPRGGLDLASRSKAQAGGDNGPAIVAGKPDESLLWQHVRDGRMPPKKPLPEGERKLLHDWIASGAGWGSDPIDPFRFSTAQRAGYDWWSLQPVHRPKVPDVRQPAAAIRNPIDAFVLARLEQAALKPAPEADRRTLIRRLSFDLIGLPPAPEEVEAFAQSAPDAYEKLVDRLLASPHFGERWARHWLDVVRFGESNGFERDLPRPNAWPYRDWVVAALNRDLPYDEFARLQLAGDRLRPDDPDAIKATGFLVAGAHDTVVPVSENMKAGMQQDETEDVVATVGQTFLGLTVQCARCHQHKFDPISQADYYRLAGALGGVRHGERELKAPLALSELTRVRQRLEEIGRRLDALEEPVRRQILAERGRKPNSGSRTERQEMPAPLGEWDFTAGLPAGVQQLGGAKRDRSGLAVDGKKAYAGTGPLSTALREKTLEAWVKLADLQQRGGAALSVQTLDGQVFDAIVFGEQEAGRWMAGSDFFRRTRPFSGPAETPADREAVHLALVYHADGTIAAYRNGKLYGTPYRSSPPVEFKAGQYRVVFGLRHEPAGGNRLLAGTILRARLHNRALTSDEIAASAGTVAIPETELVSRLSEEQRAQRRQLQAEARRLAAEAARLEPAAVVRVYAVTPVDPGPTHLLFRGEVTARGPVIVPGGVAAVARGDDLGLKPDSSEGNRRIALARWISAADNPLFARVMVNRLWQHHFGTGLVETPSDFGFSGGRPSHPELLDYLADELVRQGWRLKPLHRLIVLSAAYRRASRPDPAALKVDAGNRLLWQYAPHRLEAEAMRDSILAVSGQLDRTVGGRGYQDFRSYFFKGTQFYDPIAQVGPAFSRRTLYRMWARGGRSPLLDVFDCPDPSATAPRRTVTTTPLQALTLLNNAFVLDQADQFAQRLQREAGPDLERQLNRAYLLAYGRPVEAGERELLRRFVQKHGLAAFCRVLFNSNEFITVE